MTRGKLNVMDSAVFRIVCLNWNITRNQLLPENNVRQSRLRTLSAALYELSVIAVRSTDPLDT